MDLSRRLRPRSSRQVSRPGIPATLPHTAVELPFNYFDETTYQRRFTYQAVLPWRPEFAGREVALVFDGAMADAVVWVNGTEVAAHSDGYTPFEAPLTAHLHPGDNLVTVRIDGSENPEIPPFGGQIDYLTYAGIYRDAWLKVTDRVSIERLKVETSAVLSPSPSASVRCDIRNGAEAQGGTATRAPARPGRPRDRPRHGRCRRCEPDAGVPGLGRHPALGPRRPGALHGRSDHRDARRQRPARHALRLPHRGVRARRLPPQRPAAEAARAEPPPVLPLRRLRPRPPRRRSATPRSSSTSCASTSCAPRTTRSRRSSSTTATASASWSSRKSPAGSTSAARPGRSGVDRERPAR